MYSVISIADAILRIAKTNSVKLTPLQLMKLVYIAHGWSLAIRNIDLFGDRVEAWKFGPVIPDLYHATKKFGRNPIPFDLIPDTDGNIDEETWNFLVDVFKQYGNLSGYALSSLTHKAATPWDQTYQEGVFGLEIKDSLIAEHYKELLSDQESTATP